MAALVSDKIDFETKNVKRQIGTFYNVKGSTQQEEKGILLCSVPFRIAPRLWKFNSSQKLPVPP